MGFERIECNSMQYKSSNEEVKHSKTIRMGMVMSLENIFGCVFCCCFYLSTGKALQYGECKVLCFRCDVNNLCDWLKTLWMVWKPKNNNSTDLSNFIITSIGFGKTAQCQKLHLFWLCIEWLYCRENGREKRGGSRRTKWNWIAFNWTQLLCDIKL